jgi:hypothetical protein
LAEIGSAGALDPVFAVLKRRELERYIRLMAAVAVKPWGHDYYF